MSNTIWWGVIPVTAVGALALTLTLGGGNDEVAPQIPRDEAKERQHSTSVQTLVAADAVPAPLKPDARATLEKRVVAQQATPIVDPVAEPTRSLAPSPEMLKRAQALREADHAATRAQGPAEACLAQMKTIFCPIIGNMPFVRDVAGQVAMWGHFDCPTSAPPKS